MALALGLFLHPRSGFFPRQPGWNLIFVWWRKKGGLGGKGKFSKSRTGLGKYMMCFSILFHTSHI